jgi:hypothetical protein
MYTSPYLPGQIARERQRDMLARASQLRQARQAQALAVASQPARPASRRPRRTLRTVLRPHTQAPA